MQETSTSRATILEFRHWPVARYVVQISATRGEEVTKRYFAFRIQ
jgi:hypothetical protein